MLKLNYWTILHRRWGLAIYNNPFNFALCTFGPTFLWFTVKLYLFARLNPITAIENCTIKNRKMVIVCQQMIQLIIALIWFWQPKRQKNNKDHIYYQPHQIVLSLFSSTDLLHKNINRRQILRFCHKYCIVEY